MRQKITAYIGYDEMLGYLKGLEADNGSNKSIWRQEINKKGENTRKNH